MPLVIYGFRGGHKHTLYGMTVISRNQGWYDNIVRVPNYHDNDSQNFTIAIVTLS